MAPGHLALGGVGQHDGELRSEIAPGTHSPFLRGWRGSRVGTGHGCSRGLVQDLLTVAVSQVAGSGAHQVHSRAHRPVALMQDLRAVIEARGAAGDEEVGQMRPDLDHKAARQVHHALLRGGIGCSRSRQLAGRRLQEGRLVGQQLQSKRSSGADGQVFCQAAQGWFREAFGELKFTQMVRHLGIRSMGYQFRRPQPVPVAATVTRLAATAGRTIVAISPSRISLRIAPLSWLFQPACSGSS